ncbi:SRPBCC domain-containing protein [Microbulbifer sp. ANSA001]|uniref:SRPBCC domain-containing protein n=1 Tax=Microbulbifer sp. ANSA001 TaxID=3243358 RepID=UPI004042F590
MTGVKIEKITMSEIIWPQGFVPGFTDNYCSNELIVAGLSTTDIWPLLNTPSLWPRYYANSANIQFQDGLGPELREGTRFSFETFGFPVEARCVEYLAPVKGQPARVAWHGWAGEGDARLDVHHAWLIEDLSGDRVRILTQETQNGLPAIELAKTRPNPMINGHQDWLEGLRTEALKIKGRK